MSETAAKVKRYVILAAVALAMGIFFGMAIPQAWREVVTQGGGAAILFSLLAGFFPARKNQAGKAKEGTDAPKTKADILADDPAHSLDRLPDDARTDLDAKIDADARARADAILKRHGG